jgi:hypothetical protein
VVKAVDLFDMQWLIATGWSTTGPGPSTEKVWSDPTHPEVLYTFEYARDIQIQRECYVDGPGSKSRKRYEERIKRINEFATVVAYDPGAVVCVFPENMRYRSDGVKLTEGRITLDCFGALVLDLMLAKLR